MYSLLAGRTCAQVTCLQTERVVQGDAGADLGAQAGPQMT